MKVVKKGKGKTPWAGKKVACQGCDSKIQLEENDKLNLVGDQRDGDYYKFKPRQNNDHYFANNNVQAQNLAMIGPFF